MPTVEKVSGGRVYIRPLDRRFEIGDRVEVGDELAAYLVEERGDFEYVDVEAAGEADDEDAEDADVCGFEKDDGSVCQRSAGWGRDADTGPCKDHVDDAED